MLDYYIKYKFKSNFEIIKANTEELKQECYKIRYKVCCEEKGFEDKSNFPNQMETDYVDHISTHFLLKYRKTG